MPYRKGIAVGLIAFEDITDEEGNTTRKATPFAEYEVPHGATVLNAPQPSLKERMKGVFKLRKTSQGSEYGEDEDESVVTVYIAVLPQGMS